MRSEKNLYVEASHSVGAKKATYLKISYLSNS